MTHTPYYRSDMIGYIEQILEMYWFIYIDVLGHAFRRLSFLEVLTVLTKDR